LILVEDTQSIAYANEMEQKFNYLNVSDKNSYIPKLICQENALKVYGSLFLLYRLIVRSSGSKSVPEINSIQFWFVINDSARRDSRVSNKYDNPLKQELSGKLGKTIVNDVVVMTRSDFIERCEKASKNKAVLGVIGVQK